MQDFFDSLPPRDAALQPVVCRSTVGKVEQSTKIDLARGPFQRIPNALYL